MDPELDVIGAGAELTRLGASVSGAELLDTLDDMAVSSAPQ